MSPTYLRLRFIGTTIIAASLFMIAAPLLEFLPSSLRAQSQQVVWTDQEKPIADQIGHLRDLPDDVRARTTKQLAIRIRQLPAVPNKLRLPGRLANFSTEGDVGRDALQEVATTLAGALREAPVAAKKGQPAAPYVELAQLVRYEHMQASLDDPQFAAAMSKLEGD